jgi:hypothetical protein
MRTLLLLVLGFVSLPVSAEELQVTITGLACTLAPADCKQASYTTPFTITYDIDTRSGQQTFSVGQADLPNEGEVLNSYFASNLAVTNYSANLGGQSVAFAAHTTGGFFFDVEAPDIYDFSGGAGPSMASFFFDSFARPLVTASEFSTFQDPLASLLLEYRSTPGGCGICALGDFQENFIALNGQMTVTAVPSPGPLLLFLTGLVGIALSQRGEGLQLTAPRAALLGQAPHA